jgi:hypothetical protein
MGPHIFYTCSLWWEHGECRTWEPSRSGRCSWTTVMTGITIKQCCGSGMFISDPGSWFTHPGSKNSNKREGWKKNLLPYLFSQPQFHKIENYFIFEMLKKKMWANFKKIIKLFTQNLSLTSQQYWFGIRDPGKTYSESRIRVQGSKRHRIRNIFWPNSWEIFEIKTEKAKLQKNLCYHAKERPDGWKCLAKTDVKHYER